MLTQHFKRKTWLVIHQNDTTTTTTAKRTPPVDRHHLLQYDKSSNRLINQLNHQQVLLLSPPRWPISALQQQQQQQCQQLLIVTVAHRPCRSLLSSPGWKAAKRGQCIKFARQHVLFLHGYSCTPWVHFWISFLPVSLLILLSLFAHVLTL